MQQFGSPKEKDFVAKIEKSVNDVVERTAQHFEETVDRIAPRAIGSQKVPPDEEFAEYLTTIADTPDPTEAGFQWVSEKAQQYGLLGALDRFASYVERNERRLAKFGKSDSGEK